MENEIKHITRVSNAETNKQVRLRIGTPDTDELSRFFILVIQPHSKNLISTIRVFEDKLIPLFAWLSHSPGRESWRWHSSLPASPSFHSIRYSKRDDLLTALQNAEFKSAFEKGYRLWRDYASIFIVVLSSPTISEKVADKARLWFNEHASEVLEIGKSSRGLLSLLRSHNNLADWGNGV